MWWLLANVLWCYCDNSYHILSISFSFSFHQIQSLTKILYCKVIVPIWQLLQLFYQQKDVWCVWHTATHCIFCLKVKPSCNLHTSHSHCVHSLALICTFISVIGALYVITKCEIHSGDLIPPLNSWTAVCSHQTIHCMLPFTSCVTSSAVISSTHLSVTLPSFDPSHCLFQIFHYIVFTSNTSSFNIITGWQCDICILHYPILSS